MSDKPSLIDRARRGADHFESEGDLGMPMLLRDLADTIECLRSALYSLRNGGNLSDADWKVADRALCEGSA